ncbi:MAG TPA: START domain-containing protein [Deltaproteobacteria bacterium]|nr:START domain-containing protein [Deltaproteobacteria bacterium]HOM28778.1 START domain-containing protein [Deltaproteobacteria bacterium]HPP80566.1 START domain-containing protein [Deltaproteobacteria bacterium]
MKARLVSFLFVVAVVLPAALHAEEPWKLAKDEAGIKVYTRSVPGSSANEFKGVADVDAPLDVVIEVFKDIPSYPKWYGFCKEIRQLKQEGEFHRVIYFVLETMGPVKDRDMVVDVMEARDMKARKSTITMRAFKEDYVPRNPVYVRMTEMEGSCVLTQVGDQTTNVVYTVKADPAGYIPAFISNMIQKEQPFLTLKGLKEMVKKDLYRERAAAAPKG